MLFLAASYNYARMKSLKSSSFSEALELGTGSYHGSSNASTREKFGKHEFDQLEVEMEETFNS